MIGYIGRAASTDHTGELGPYVTQSLFILVAPALLAASIYMTLGRVMRSVKGEHLSVIRTSRLTKTFVIGDIVSFFVQSSAAGLMVSASTTKLGNDCVIAGLFIQVILFGLFFMTAIVFQVRLRKTPTQESHTTMVPWKQILWMIYAVSTLIMVRSIYRAVGYIQGQGGYSLTHEWTLYVFDSVPMLLVAVVFLFFYPGRIQPSSPDSDMMGTNASKV